MARNGSGGAAGVVLAGVVGVLVGVGAPGLAGQQARAYDHVHFSVPDPETAQAWYMEHLGGVLGESPDRVAFDGIPWSGRDPMPVQLLWARSPEGAGPASGSPIAAIGLAVSDVAAKLRELEAAGVKVLASPTRDPAGWTSAAVEDPWGVRIELVHDGERSGFHHVTVRSADPGSARAWYLDRFGGEAVRLGEVDGVRYGTMYLLVVPGSDEPFTPGYGINHVAWAAHRMDPLAARLRAAGEVFTTEPREALNRYGHRVAFLQGPDDVRIEVVEHTQCPFSPAEGRD